MIVLIVLGSLLRLLAPIWDSPLNYLFSDPARHWADALNFARPNLIAAGDPLGYQIYLAIVQFITARNTFAVSISAGVLSILMPWLYYRSARELQLNQERALAAWVLIAWMPSLFSVYHYFLIETLLLPLQGLALWMSARAYRKQTIQSLLVATACWSFTIITKPTPAPMALVLMVWIWWKTGHQWRRALACLALGFFFFVPSLLRSWQAFGEPLPLGNLWIHNILHRSDCKTIRIVYGESNFWFSSPSCYTLSFSPLNRWMIRRSYENRVVEVNIRIGHEGEDFRSAAGRIKSTPEKRVARWLENGVIFLYASSWPENTSSGWKYYLHAWQRWLWMPLIFLVCWLNVTEFRKRQPTLLSLATTTFMLALFLQNSFTMEGRYRKPLEPLLLINVCAFIPLRCKRHPKHT